MTHHDLALVRSGGDMVEEAAARGVVRQTLDVAHGGAPQRAPAPSGRRVRSAPSAAAHAAAARGSRAAPAAHAASGLAMLQALAWLLHRGGRLSQHTQHGGGLATSPPRPRDP